MDKLVSIVIPVYNVEEYLKECVDSVIGQSYQNLEIILVDDGSTDESGRICDEYLKRDARITVFHKTNGGLSDARNYGIERCNGEYLYLLDSDDFIVEKTIDDMVYCIEKYDADMVIAGVRYVDEQGNPLEIIKNMAKGVFEGESKKECFYNSYKNSVQLATAWNKLYRLSKLRSVLYYPVGKIHEDEFVAHYLWAKADRVVALTTPFYMYRRRKNSITDKNHCRKNLDAVEAFLDRVKFVNEYDNKYIDHTIRRFADVFYGAWKGRKEDTVRGCSDRLKELYKSYRKLYISISKKCIAPKGRIIAFSLYINPTVYGLVTAAKRAVSI